MRQINTSKRGNKGMVATSQATAAQVGRDILARGGNAVDAAIATAATLTVVEPTCNGIGGDVFAQVWMKNELHGLNASSISPAKMTPEEMQKRGFDTMPPVGWESVTVPGAPAAWAALHERWGTLPLNELLAPAIELANEGFEVTPTVAFLWQQEHDKFKNASIDADLVKEWFRVFTREGKVPVAGNRMTFKDHAKTLKEIAETNVASFYSGSLADAIDKHSRDTNGLIRKSDLENYAVDWVKPISTHYRDHDIWQIPPNGQGLVVLMALRILEGFEFTPDERHSTDTLHKQIEALKLAYTDGQAHITQHDNMQISINAALSDAYTAERRACIQQQAIQPFAGSPKSGGTVYLATADEQGNMVSMMQSNFYGFGSGVVVPNTGIALHSRGYDFSLNPEHPNYLAPNKRTFHTIIPGFITKQEQGVQHAIGSFGVMGAYMQPQGQLQVIMNMLDFGMDPQTALNQPRWQWFGDKTIGIEKGFDDSVFQSLKGRGHEIKWAEDASIYGRGQIILKDSSTNQYIAGTEPRCDGEVAVVD